MMNEHVQTSVRAIYRRRAFVLSVTAVATLVSIILVLLAPSEYTAEVILLRNRFTASGAIGDLLPPQINAKACESILLSLTTLGQTLDRLKIANVWETESGVPRLESFTRKVSVEVRVLDETTRPVNYSPFLILRVKGDNPERVRQIADTWAEVGIEIMGHADALTIAAAASSLSANAAVLDQSADDVRDRLAEARANFNLDVMNTQLDQKVLDIEELIGRLTRLEQSRAGAEKQLQSLREALALEAPVLELFGSPSDDVYWTRRQEGASSEELAELKRQGMKSEIQNEVYVQLRADETQTAMRLASETAEIAMLQQKMVELEEVRVSLQAGIAEQRSIQNELTVEEETLLKAYAEVKGSSLLAAAIASLTSSVDDTIERPIGLNRISTEVYYRRAGSQAADAARVALTALVVFSLAAVFVASAHWWSILLQNSAPKA